MDAINNKSITDAAFRDKTTTMERLKFALSRIDSEEFGKCQKCGDEIAIKRLMSLPYAPLCINCAQIFR
jgi:DnaK suppressor protein